MVLFFCPQVQTLKGGKWYYAEYTMFSVESEANNYIIHLAGYIGNGGDSLTNTSVDPLYWNHNGMAFSTYDVDNDRRTHASCASIYSSGWWFNNCYWTCLTCVYSSNDFCWYTLNDSPYNEQGGLLRAARMMIRRNYP